MMYTLSIGRPSLDATVSMIRMFACLLFLRSVPFRSVHVDHRGIGGDMG